MQTAGDVRSVQDVALPDRTGRLDRSADDVRRDLVHLREAVRVGSAQTVDGIGLVGVIPRALHRGDVLGGVHRLEQRIVGRRRGHDLELVEDTERPRELDREFHPDRTHRVPTTEVVRRQPVVENQHRLTTHAPTITVRPAEVVCRSVGSSSKRLGGRGTRSSPQRRQRRRSGLTQSGRRRGRPRLSAPAIANAARPQTALLVAELPVTFGYSRALMPWTKCGMPLVPIRPARKVSTIAWIIEGPQFSLRVLTER